MSAPLRIALTADPYIPVPPTFYGGIERVVYSLAMHLVARGHDVTLFAHPASAVRGATLVPYGVPPHRGIGRRARELAQVGGRLFRRRAEFDVVHSFGRLAALAPVLACRAVPKYQSYQRAVPWKGIRRAVCAAGESLQFTACSASMFVGHAVGSKFGRWRAIFNGVDLTAYQYAPTVADDAPLVCLGKVMHKKGVHVAIAIAKLAGRRLVIAGDTVDSGPDRDYFVREILPAVDGERVQYVGPVDDVQKNQLLGRAAALVFPTMYAEPFGIVMAEAMACGTPVIGPRRGALLEVVQPGVTGSCATALRRAQRRSVSCQPSIVPPFAATVKRASTPPSSPRSTKRCTPRSSPEDDRRQTARAGGFASFSARHECGLTPRAPSRASSCRVWLGADRSHRGAGGLRRAYGFRAGRARSSHRPRDPLPCLESSVDAAYRSRGYRASLGRRPLPLVRIAARARAVRRLVHHHLSALSSGARDRS